MRRFLRLLLCLAALALMPLAASAHGPGDHEPFDSADEHAHYHAASAHTGEAADEFEELHEQIADLKEQLQAHDRRARMTDIIGGIGYIAGVSGAAFYYFGVRRKRAPLS